MEIIAVAAALGVLWLYEQSKNAPQATTATPAPPLATTPYIPSGVPLSGAYQVTPEATMINAQGPQYTPPQPGSFLSAISGIFAQSGGVTSPGQLSAAISGTITPPTTLPGPPPSVMGGIAGTVGSGGNPLGGIVRPGISLGTATTSISMGPSGIGIGTGAAAANRATGWLGVQVIS